ncbi:uncharacterized protein B0T15DRAFT_163654 [Chaetomium strumarium]|uniref:BZIP domain-containing protein n=1 Tax=Chaetomium strumarium TaxID=1170767 RepID=A0AAJ0M2W9_9PEZI|nr:hypothetical protein B0T15DRAFT_163654 [Chaetomium strumarium]
MVNMTNVWYRHGSDQTPVFRLDVLTLLSRLSELVPTPKLPSRRRRRLHFTFAFTALMHEKQFLTTTKRKPNVWFVVNGRSNLACISKSGSRQLLLVVAIISSMPSSAEQNIRQRVRDNQRRSRARRKEYLQELEQRVRRAELQGVQASVEVQAAARQVAEENRKLRVLLRHHGISESSIETYLASGVVTPPSASSVGTPALAGRSSIPSTVQRLEHVLGPRKPSTSGSNCTSSSASPSGDDENHNCSMAADLISSMTGANPHEVRTSLGCAPGTDCHVDNTKISDAIEQLTEAAVMT